MKRFNKKPSDQIRSQTSHHFHWCSTDLSPNPPTFDRTSPRRSASLHPPDLHSLVANLVVLEVKSCDGLVDAQGIGQGLDEMASRASSRLVEQNGNPNHFFQKAFHLYTWKDIIEFQTWSNLWCLDFSQVASINIWCVSKLPARWSRKKLLQFYPIDAQRIPVFHHHQALRSSPILLPCRFSHVILWLMRRASAKAWTKNGASNAFRIHF